jgi:hypothetical protein
MMKAAHIAGWTFLTLTVAFSTEQSVAGVIRHDRADADYRTLADGYQSVGMIRGSTGLSGYMGSGTLIADDWVLTAGHVVDAAQSMSFFIGGERYEAADWIAHPQWDGSLGKGYDIALVHLDRAVSGIDPAERYRGWGEAGNIATAIGYGRSGDGATGASTGPGTKRAGQNLIDGVDARSGGRILTSDFDSPFGLTQPLDMEYLIAPGDSGGGLFVDSPLGPLLAGVHSFGAATDGTLNSDYGDLSGHTRVAAFNDWIDSIVGLADSAAVAVTAATSTLGAASELDVKSRETTTPEPSGLMLATWAIMSLLAGTRLRRV